ncbi:MAG TPA: DUF2784 domain-containing protein [Planctomycetaceae bacterium]|nr:DUF2784 domain-containing protein [Planctomycetaceae bacterium]
MVPDRWILLLLADLLVALHAALVLFAVGGLVVTLIGASSGWQWVRNVWFRGAHLSYVLFVAFEAVVGWPCPLTVWESRLRTLAGKATYPGSFIGRWIEDLLYVEIDPVLLNGVYVVFGAAVIASWWLVPPRRKLSLDSVC